MSRGDQLGGSSDGTTFTVISFSGETSYDQFGDDAGVAWGCQLDGSVCFGLEHAVKFSEFIGK